MKKFIYDEEIEIRTTSPALTALICVLILVIIGLLIWCYTGCGVSAPQTGSAEAVLTEEQREYVAFFKRHGSPQPEAMAMAVSAVKAKNRPMLAAISIVESGGDPKAVGDSGDSIGAFQVQPKHWGPVSESPVQQALQAERILEELLEASRGRLRSGLARYNGGVRPPKKSFKYADRVIRIARGL